MAVGLCLLSLGFGLFACDDEEEAPGASAESEVGQPVGDLELPTSLRTGDGAPGAGAAIEATTEQLRINDQVVTALEKGRVPEAEQQDGTIPKLAAKLSGQSAIKLRLQANIAYDTFAMILNTAKQAGIHEAHLQVRKVGGSPDTGWLSFHGFTTSSKAEDLPTMAGVQDRSWNDFTDQWEAVYEACRSAQSGNCAYVNKNFAQGGTLRMELMTSGRGINVNFFRRGLTREQEAAEEKKLAKEMAKKKEDFLQGRITEEELIEAMLLGDPSTYALFQFRYQEALTDPSPITDTVKPMCTGKKCGIVLTADPITPIVRVASLMGAAFPDGSTAPAVSFELPWTKKPPPEDLAAFIAAQKAKGQ